MHELLAQGANLCQQAKALIDRSRGEREGWILWLVSELFECLVEEEREVLQEAAELSVS
jgi:hypothetical protein